MKNSLLIGSWFVFVILGDHFDAILSVYFIEACRQYVKGLWYDLRDLNMGDYNANQFGVSKWCHSARATTRGLNEYGWRKKCHYFSFQQPSTLYIDWWLPHRIQPDFPVALNTLLNKISVFKTLLRFGFNCPQPPCCAIFILVL